MPEQSLFKRPASPGGKPGNKKEYTMNKRHGLLCGFAVIALAAIFTLTGCVNPNSGDSITISGIPRVGQTLTATTTGILNGKMMTWHRSDDQAADGLNDTELEIGLTYTLVEADRGKYIFGYVQIGPVYLNEMYYSNVLGPVE
jgi:hypothetical protein